MEPEAEIIRAQLFALRDEEYRTFHSALMPTVPPETVIGVMFTFNTLIFNLVIAAITLIAVHEIYSAPVSYTHLVQGHGCHNGK